MNVTTRVFSWLTPITTKQGSKPVCKLPINSVVLSIGLLISLASCSGGNGSSETISANDSPVLSVVGALSDTQIQLSFSNGPFDDSSLNKDNYEVEYCTVILSPCPSEQVKTLYIRSVDFNADTNKVTLNTFPTLPNVTYYVSTSNLQDDLGNTTDNSVRLTFTTAAPVDTDSEGATTKPALVNAISTSNTSVIISFDKDMGISAENVNNYIITQDTVNTEVGTLIIYDAYFLVDNGDHYSVVLETSPQNEVTYRVSVANSKDSYGNPVVGIIQVPGGTLDTRSTTFAGTAPQLIDLIVATSSWVDSNENNIIDAGDIIGDGNINIVLIDVEGDGIVDNWVDTDGDGTINTGDSVSGFQDSDGDGLADHQELYGINVFVEWGNGEVSVVTVTSDPEKADTDGDGLNDLEELNIGSNPRNIDTDSDNISDYTEWNVVYSDPNMQDTDLDGLIDGLEHYFYRTSVLLADSDGDQLSDSAELLELNRNPRIADLPELSISIGDVRLQIDERYSYTDETGETITQESSSSSSLANSQNSSYSHSDSGSTEKTWSIYARAGVGNGSFFGGDNGLSGGVEVTAGGGETYNTSWQTDKSSAQESQQVYEQSLSKGRELSSTSSVSREITGARIDVDLTISNVGNVPFTISNIEITVLEQVGNQDKYLPVATLISNSELISGTPLVVNLGAFTSERGPFVFTSREVFPNLVEAIMRNPSALVFRVANYDISDELGRNHTFINQLALDRTGSITLDYGDAETAKRYLVATNGALDDQGSYVGGFSAVNGKTKGLPINYVLQNILGMSRHDTALDQIAPGSNASLDSSPQGDDVQQLINGINVITAGPNGWLETRPVGDDFIVNPTAANGIIAGLNKTVDSIAQGDDIQRVPVNSTGLSIGTIVIEPGGNGVLDTPALGDDKTDFVYGYETSKSCSALSNKAGNICRADNDCSCQSGDSDSRCAAGPVVTGSCSGPQRLVRVNSLRNGDFNRGWVILTSGNLPDAADFNQIIVDPGDSFTMAFLQDLDNDGLFARHEFLFGSTDSSRDLYDNTTFGENFDASATGNADGLADSVDTDHDGLSDYAEAFVGWRVSADGGALRQVFSSPRFSDTDGDGLLDVVEQDLRNYCKSDDPRSDGLCAFQAEPVSLADAVGIIAGTDGIADSAEDGSGNSTLLGDDELLITYGTSGLAYGTPIVGAGPDGILETLLQGDDAYESLSTIPPATDPSVSDTDQDGISDYTELEGFDTTVAIVDGGNGVAETPRNGDDIQRAFADNPVFPGSIIMLPGANDIIDSVPGGDDSFRPALTGLTADPLRRDTDGDDITDGLELSRGSNPIVVDGSDFTDSDQDGLTDNEESSLGWLVSVDGGASFLVKSSPYLADTDFDGLADFIERDMRTNPNDADTDGDGISDYDEINDLSKYVTIAALYPNINITSTTTSGYGTNPKLSDTDGDGLSDKQELIDGFRFVIPGSSDAILVYTQAIYADTDLDGVDDGVEIALGTDPTNPDTDGDGRKDGAEIGVSDPLIPDVAYKIIVRHLTTNNACTDTSTNVGELLWWFVLNEPTDKNGDGYPDLISDALDTEPLRWAPSNETGPRFYGAQTVLGTNYLDQSAVPNTFYVNDTRACYTKLLGSTNYWLNLNKESQIYTLKQGESINLQGLIAEGDGFITSDCGLPPRYIPTNYVASQKAYILNKTYFYEDLANATSGITLTNTDAEIILNLSSCAINFQVDIEIVR